MCYFIQQAHQKKKRKGFNFNQYKNWVECLELFATFEITLQKCQMVVLSLNSNLESLLKGLDIFTCFWKVIQLQSLVHWNWKLTTNIIRICHFNVIPMEFIPCKGIMPLINVPIFFECLWIPWVFSLGSSSILFFLSILNK